MASHTPYCKDGKTDVGQAVVVNIHPSVSCRDELHPGLIKVSCSACTSHAAAHHHRSRTAATSGNDCEGRTDTFMWCDPEQAYLLLLQTTQQAAGAAGTQTTPKNVLVDLAPGATVGFGNQNGYPKISAQAPGSGFSVAQVRQTI